MTKLNPALNFFLTFAKVKAVVTRRFDSSLGGLCFSELLILVNLSQAQGEKLRRIDLAEKVGLTASGVTRQLIPMEKVGLVKRESNVQDARVSYVTLAPGGKRVLVEALERAEILADELLPKAELKKVQELMGVLTQLSKL